MDNMSLNDIRSKFLEFFKEKGHYVEKSFSLVPENDKSLLLINAGMAPLKNYFMGIDTPPSKRMATCQKCIRTGDIENVGKTDRHGTFFEMLGNFSFGDYFKEQSIEWGWEFITKWLKLPVERLWVSVYEEDDEAFNIWKDKIGIPEDRIVRLGKDDNFWEIGVGPCGPCSEIFFDRGEKYGCGLDTCAVGCECDRYIEFWNHVFTQFNRDEEGNYTQLQNKNIDTGMGLERIAAIMQGVDSIFEIDTIKYILNRVCSISGKEYGVNSKDDISIRIITDHIRAVTFLIADGVLPNNEGRGYVLRRLLRRALRHGKLLGIEGTFLSNLVDSVVEVSGDAYPNIRERIDYIKKIILIEEERFEVTIDQGLSILNSYIDEINSLDNKILSGKKAFKLYDTFGFPLDLTKEILEEKGIFIDEDEFNLEMQRQKERARKARENAGDASWEGDLISELEFDKEINFVGYNLTEVTSTVLAIIKDDEIVSEAFEGDSVKIILDVTPFYPKGGGQVGDSGILRSDECYIEVKETTKGHNGIIVQDSYITKGKVCVDDVLNSLVSEKRKDTARNHSATHILQSALREVLGEHVAQAGSYVDSERLRFDFTHFEALTSDEISKIENIVNDKIFASLEVSSETMSIDEAKKIGAMALFGEKYGDKVRVVKMGDYSVELCGGTHVKNTSDISMFKILSESGIASGVRRIEAITGRKVRKLLLNYEKTLVNISKTVKSNLSSLEEKIISLLDENKNLSKELKELKEKSVGSLVDTIRNEIKVINGFNVIFKKFEDVDVNSLKTIGDKLKDNIDNSIILFASINGKNVNFVLMASKNSVKKGIHAGNIIREVSRLTNGGGGGSPTMAQAGGKDSEKVDKAFDKFMELISNI